MSESFPGMDDSFPGMDHSFPGIRESFPGIRESFPGMDDSFPGMDGSFDGKHRGVTGGVGTEKIVGVRDADMSVTVTETDGKRVEVWVASPIFRDG